MNEERQSPVPGRQTQVELRVRYTDCDPMGVAHHSVYPVWMEIARTELLRGLGVAYRDLEEQDILFVVARMSLRYRRPAKYDDLLRILVREVELPTESYVKIDHDYEIRRGQDLLATANTTLVCVDREGRPQRIPQAIANSSATPERQPGR